MTFSTFSTNSVGRRRVLAAEAWQLMDVGIHAMSGMLGD